jgi:hypothetical protein
VAHDPAAVNGSGAVKVSNVGTAKPSG